MRKKIAGYFYLSIALTLLGFSGVAQPARLVSADLSKERSKTITQLKLIDIMIQGDQAVLKSKNEAVITPVLKAKNEKILEYLIGKYPQYGTPAVDKNDVAMTWFGLICAMYEANNFKPLKDIRLKNLFSQGIPGWLSCTLGVLGASYGINELIGSLGAFSYKTVWSMVKFVVKKYAVGWLGTAVALYEVATECF